MTDLSGYDKGLAQLHEIAIRCIRRGYRSIDSH